MLDDCADAFIMAAKVSFDVDLSESKTNQSTPKPEYVNDWPEHSDR